MSIKASDDILAEACVVTLRKANDSFPVQYGLCYCVNRSVPRRVTSAGRVCREDGDSQRPLVVIDSITESKSVSVKGSRNVYELISFLRRTDL